MVEDRARKLGFDTFAVTRPDSVPGLPDRLARWLVDGHHGDMAWMGDRADQRAAPSALWDDVRSIVMLGLNAAPDQDPLDNLARKDRGTIASYAQRRDYHEVIKGKLKEIGGLLSARSGRPAKVFVDTAPVMEKPLAAAAGLGWQGKHTVLISREFGNWMLLGAIYSAAELEPDAPGRDSCGTCRRCLDICPTGAFPEPYRLDARRCISYLTIEHAGPIPHEFREAIGNRIFGCDDCLAVCPWNKFAERAGEAKMAVRADLASPSLAELARLDDAAFRAFFAGTPVKRTGRDRFLRNVLIAIGNSGDPALAEEAARCLDDPAPVVRGAAVWACGQLLDDDRVGALRAMHAPIERDATVREEWHALNPCPSSAKGREPGAVTSRL
ncbi:tRNA epoxyqueuosine(34) reductase QueG [Methylobacterium gnaphalii]|uniref:Epoxyqueuosine reductase n=1 Tax=Methylobacterium gnaphalii TaxID=1010610 RepID=A0A512JN46_9HYPH|nr:tRNA epoxyqueuosine(34) reductase QueG [Methylobacterium gnaphalii]GEP11386.1 epoxyqueuosine reductase [Methylobacterium gnaphalii]GJD71119.1 Epoxyqueuosine reductase [Methylobacterium gnaphalii]GLS47980.1 epoxyqueuosine reductase [Methylobacterium gnaphalii]